MRQKQLKCVFTFSSTTAAMHAESVCRARGIAGRLIPVPGSLRSGCGLCWRAPTESREALEALVTEERLAVDGIYLRTM